MLEWRRRAAAANDDAALRAVAELEIDIALREDAIAARLAATRDLPLQLVGERFGLSPTERRALALLVALEVSPGESQTSATLGLLEAVIYRSDDQRDRCVEELAPDGRLFVHRLAELGSRADLPKLATPVRAMPRVIELALGRLRLDLDVACHATLIDAPASADHLLLPDEMRAAVDDAIRMQAGGFAAAYPVPVIVGPEGTGRASLVYGASRALGRPVLEVQASALPREVTELDSALGAIRREATLFSAVLLVRELQALNGDEARMIPDLVPRVVDAFAGHAGPLAMTATRACWPRISARPALTIDLPIPNELERGALFERALRDAELAVAAAARYRVSGGLIERAATAAHARATARKTAVELGDLRVAIRGLLDSDLSTLGRRVEWHQTWNDVVLTEDIHDEIRELISRVQNRKRVLDDWGFARKVGKGTGVSALFSGPPGTGKTMVAGLIANELELDLYQIDTSKLVSKWVGETEKNLARLFDAAAAGHAVLLFDEADSLFAKRTDVKSSNDRYANLEVNYLLQRMESFDGISILTTNHETSVDEAFRRRLAFRVAFPLPEIDEREKLWRVMLPAEAETAAKLDFHALAERFEMSGGYIRNAVLRAAYLAAADGSAITQRHLQRAATLEYTATGKIIQHRPSRL